MGEGTPHILCLNFYHFHIKVLHKRNKTDKQIMDIASGNTISKSREC